MNIADEEFGIDWIERCLRHSCQSRHLKFRRENHVDNCPLSRACETCKLVDIRIFSKYTYL